MMNYAAQFTALAWILLSRAADYTDIIKSRYGTAPR